MNSLIFKQLTITGTKYSAMLCVDVPIADNVALRVGQISNFLLCTLDRPYKITDLDPTVLIF